MPLIDKFLAMLWERDRQRLLKSCYRAVKTFSKRDANRELATAGKVDFTDHGHIAVLGLVKLPVQLESPCEGPATRRYVRRNHRNSC